MAFANANISDIIATTIESRTRKIADNVTSNNALLSRLKTKGKIKTFSGGQKILQELSFAENSNAGWYSGYDLLPVGASDVISAAEYEIKQAAVPVIISGLEQLLEAAVPVDPSNDTYGGIDSSTYSFWRNATSDPGAVTSATIQGFMNGLWAELVRGADRPDLIPCDADFWEMYVASLQSQQRFSNTNDGDAGFTSVKYMEADVVLDGGIYTGAVTGATGAPAGTAFFLNTDYIHYRPHRDRNMVSLSPNRRYATNQDAEVQILAWAGNMTCSGRQFQGRLDINT